MELKIIEKSVDELIPYVNNARTHSEEQVYQLAASIKEFGFNNPILLDGENGVIAGHGRLMAAKKLKLEKVPCIELSHLSESQKRAFILADNKLALNADWDNELLNIELEALKDDDIDLSLIGFSDDELEEISKEFTEEEKPFTDEEADEIPKEVETKCKLGDLWQLGEHRLLCGDSTDENCVKKLMNGEKCQLTFTDPPYEIQTQGGGILKNLKQMKDIKNNKVDTFDPSVIKLYSETNIYFHNKSLIKKYIELAEKNSEPYDLAIYNKERPIPNYKGHLMTDIEYIAIIGKQDPNKGLEMSLYSKLFVGHKDNDNELGYSKPVELCEKFIKLYSKGKVLDLFGGTGSTLIACEKLKHKCFIMEHNPKYADVIIQRWENLTGKKAELING